MELKHKGKELSPKAEARISSALAAIEQANSQFDWDKYAVYVTVRVSYRWRLPIFPKRNVFLDVCELTDTWEQGQDDLEIPAGVFGDAPWKKRPLRRNHCPKWIFRMRDLKAKKRRGKVVITMKKGE